MIGRLSVPKYRFIGWMAAWRRLKTKDKLCQVGVAADDLCLLCHQDQESTDHLFFQCEYSIRCCDVMQKKLIVPCAQKDLNWATIWCNGVHGRFRKAGHQALFLGLIYMIWKQRNNVLWNQKVVLPSIAVSSMMMEAHTRIMQVLPKKLSAADRSWIASLN